eukprot:CAMPEP_0182425160 /NCGR_PEP_ID=MMETSP1167-20130531/11516_1 /TAXON_ID=2988 /ORGANISM="Mallomonas Sp, Strain CCMP3275" /LENGTH=408 /DNA_ID=CAMNT_0024605597 /DNA_START=587 /DNA_END=1810 /DNA_ORIENTATION=+
MIDTDLAVIHSSTNSTSTSPTSTSTSTSSMKLLSPEDEWETIALNYTSGTTGLPKGVVYHHRGAYLNALGNIIEWNMEKHPQYLWIVPMFHCNGWCFPWSLAATAGTSYMLRSVQPDKLFHIIQKYKVQYLAGAPVTMNIMLSYPHRFKFTHKIQMWTAGAPPPPSVINQFESEIGILVTPAYGLTETYGPISTNCTDISAERERERERERDDEIEENSDGDSVYKSDVETSNIYGETHREREREKEEKEEEENIKRQYTQDCQRLYQSCSIITEEMTVRDPVSMIQVTADGETLGEVMIRGNNVMKGYLFNKQATHDSLGSDWFKTGDLAVLHRNGRIELKDRSKDIIISGGENISSIEVENAIITHNCVQEVAVIAIEDKMWGEVPCCFVVCVPGKSVTDQELEEW